MDTVIDQGFPVLENYGVRMEELEIQLLESPEKRTLNVIHHMKRELLFLRRTIWPHREVLNILIRDDLKFISEHTKIYFRDCYDHIVQIMDLLETYRDMSAGMLDIYLSSISYRLNEIMRVLTIISTIFIPLTFLVGVYGMNFGNNTSSPWAMPELNWYYGYPVLLGSIFLIAVGMLVFFKRNRWL
jgi:magnesium transporter